MIVEEPPPFASVTVLPAIGCDCASLSVTVIVEVVAPSAATEAGAALTVDCAAVTGPGREGDRRRLRDRDGVGGVGRRVGGRLDRRVLDRERRDAGAVRDAGDGGDRRGAAALRERHRLARDRVRVRVLSVTVIVEVVLLSASTDAGDADTVDCAAVTGPAVNVTVAVCVTVTVSVVSVAV